MDQTTVHIPRVVIIGSGFGGLFAAQELRKALVRVTVIGKTTHHLFQPLLYQVATGILSQGEIAPATREILKKQLATSVLVGEVTDIDVHAKTVTHRLGLHETVTEYDYLIVAAGATGSYFGHDEYEAFAPGLKTVDDALEIRGRIFGAFEIAELEAAEGSPERLAPWLTFVVVGAGPTGVEMAGQIRELATRALTDEYRNFDPRSARVILLDAGNAVLSSFGPKQSARVKAHLEKMGIEVELGAMVTNINASSVDVKYHDGTEKRIEAKCKVWAAGVAASPLAKILAEQTGAGIDHAGRIMCKPDLTLPGHDEVFVVGDMISLDDLPGVAQVAMQGGKYAARQIKHDVGGDNRAGPFQYFDKGNMASVSRFQAVANVGKLQLYGFIAWCMWLVIHIFYLVGFQQRLSTLGHWAVAFIGRGRSERTITTYQSMGAIGLIAEDDQAHAISMVPGQDTIGHDDGTAAA